MQANEWKSQRAFVQSVLEASERDELDQKTKAGLSEHPLYSWIEVLAYKKRLNAKTLSLGDRQAIEALLQRYNSLAAGDWLRTAYLNYLSSQKDWASFSRFYRGSDNDEMLCADLNARLALNKVDDAWAADAENLAGGKCLEYVRCRIHSVERYGKNSTMLLRWKRIELAMHKAKLH